jgi:hypothetical protein
MIPIRTVGDLRQALVGFEHDAELIGHYPEGDDNQNSANFIVGIARSDSVDGPGKCRLHIDGINYGP